MSENWQIYQKVGSRWETVCDPMPKDAAEKVVEAQWSILNFYEKAVAEAKKTGKKCRVPDPGFREPHCVPV
jgi:hypothetical protein